MIRLEVFQNVSDAGKRFVAILEAMETSESGKQTIATCMNFFASTEEEARQNALDFLKSERDRIAKAEIDKNRLAVRMRAKAELTNAVPANVESDS